MAAQACENLLVLEACWYVRANGGCEGRILWKTRSDVPLPPTVSTSRPILPLYDTPLLPHFLNPNYENKVRLSPSASLPRCILPSCQCCTLRVSTCMASSMWVGDWARSSHGSASINLSATATQDSTGHDLISQSQIQRQSHRCISKSLAQTSNVTGKRVRVEGSRVAMSYPRKRAVTACELCRARKRKCNNARPRCKFCEDAGVECSYGDPGDHSS